MFVAVRAIAPVAGMPPNSGDAMFATPCATSSMFDRCLPPIIPSATTADRSDSIAASIAIVNAGPTSPVTWLSVKCGNCGCGTDGLSGPKWLPIVSMGRCAALATTVPSTSATNGAGIRWLILGHATRISSESAATPTAAGVTLDACAANALHFGRNSAGTVPIRNPSRSFT